MQLDSRTLVVIAVLMALVAGAIEALIWRTRQVYPGFGRWTIGNLSLVACLVLLGLRGTIPDLISIVVANTLAVCAAILLLEGIREFCGMRPPWWPAYALGGGALVAVVYFNYAVNKINFRIIAMSLSLGIIGLVAGITLLRDLPAGRRVSMTFTGIIFTVVGVADIFRAAYFYAQAPLSDLFAPSGMNAFLFAGLSLAMVGWTFGFFMLTSERLVQDLRGAEPHPRGKAAARVVPLGKPVSESEVRGQLKKIIESDVFRRSARMERFLTLAVERVLTGHPEQLKEYAVGRDVFNRGEDYDPRADSIVRVEAQRLRRKLREYYESAGAQDPVILEVLPGSYVPHFRYRGQENESASCER